MKESKIRKSILNIFTSYVHEQVFAECELHDYCAKWNLCYEDVSTGKYRVRNLEGEHAFYRFRTANDQVAAMREVLKIFYTRTEIWMLYGAARHSAEDSRDVLLMQKAYAKIPDFNPSKVPYYDPEHDTCDEDDGLGVDEDEYAENEKRMKEFADNFNMTKPDDADVNKKPPEDGVYTIPKDKLSTYYKKCDDKATLYENMVKAAIEADEPTAEDYDSQAKAEAGISDKPDDTPYDSTSQAIYGRRYQESHHEDGVTPEQMNAIDDAVQKAYEESANN